MEIKYDSDFQQFSFQVNPICSCFVSSSSVTRLHFLSILIQVSALITGEFYARNQFPGFGRPYVCYAEILLKFVVILLPFPFRVVGLVIKY